MQEELVPGKGFLPNILNGSTSKENENVIHEGGRVKRSPLSHSQTCANYECGRKTELVSAPQFVCAYFGLSIENHRRIKFCKKCFQEAENHQSMLVKMIKDHQPIIIAPKKPRNQMVTLDDDSSDGKTSSDIDDVVEIEGELQQIVADLLDTCQFEKQVEESVNYLDKKWSECRVRLKELDEIHSELEKNLDNFRKELYSAYEPKVNNLEEIDIDVLGQISNHSSTTSAVLPESKQSIFPPSFVSAAAHQALLPPMGPFVHTPIKNNQAVYAVKSSLLSPWGKGRVIKTKPSAEMIYAVRFDTGGKVRNLPLKYLAYAEPSPVQLSVGARVIAQYVEDKDGKEKVPVYSYYAGVVAEAPKYLNLYRYLIFFDDGYAQYCTHDQVIMVCHSSRDVWHDIHPNSRSFVSNYLKQFPERAMVKLQRNQYVKTELNGVWFQGRVETVDASLAYIQFLSDNRFEWIYRGSTRLHPLYELLANAEARKNQGATRPTHNLALIHKKKNAPYVEYTRGDVEPPFSTGSTPLESSVPNNQHPSQESDASHEQITVRAVARKSTSKVMKSTPCSPSSRPRPDDLGGSNEHKGNIRNSVNESYHATRFEPHQCSNRCIERFPYSEESFKNINPLSVPMLCGWSREVTKTRNGGRLCIVYRAPCGRRMRNMDEVHRYLRLTVSDLGVDLFCFDSFVHCFAEFEPSVVYSTIKDITYGVENVPVSCVNSIDRSNPEYVEYSTKRTPREGVHLNLDTQFLVCCDCKDDCQDKETCSCWQLTINATSATSGKINQNAGYQHRRLMDNVATGIYECNSQCSCRKTCLNRVAQRPLQRRLQLFRTEKRGWGIRCLDDIPKGEFICVYAGQLLTDQEANDDGKQLGDEYLAELDLIETIEQAKDGYESDVDDIDQPSDSSQASASDGESDGSSSVHSESKTVPAPNQQNKATAFADSSSDKVSNATNLPPVSQKHVAPKENKVPLKKTRELYGVNEHCYVMDAKTTGNIGRYLNHSCKPNVIVQNVFVDSQDLRFPWVAFFSHCYIRAGTELTWDYSYQVGSVPDKTLYCQCGTKECRGRLL